MPWGDALVLKGGACVLGFCARVPFADAFVPCLDTWVRRELFRSARRMVGMLGRWMGAAQRFLGTPGRCLFALRKCLRHPGRFLLSCGYAGNSKEVLGCPGVIPGCSTEVLSFTRKVLECPVEMLECSGGCLRSLGNAWLPG